MMSRRASLRGLLLAAAIAALASSPAALARDALRVCADPNNLPFSHKNETGFENKLAKLWADKLGVPLEYTWFPQRLGFLRNTLNAPAPDRPGFKCDVVMGVPAQMDSLRTTKPYYRSTYALVFPTGHGLDSVDSGQAFIDLPASQKEKLRVATYTPTPGATWLARHGYLKQTVAYPVMSGDPEHYPGILIDQDLIQGKVDAAVIWGPVAGYHASLSKDVPLRVIPLDSEPPDVVFDFAISAGVRFADEEGQKELNRLIDETRDQIERLLAEYHVPLVDGEPPH
jgi:quinoprotein dehydrogenase-associated probable ABC transporter substrate-binding protein